MNDTAHGATAVTSTFRPHDTTLLDVWRIGRLRFKVYGITSVGHVDPDLIEATRRLCADIEDAEAHGLGWITIHQTRPEEHTSELQSLMRISYAVFCLKKKTNTYQPY